MTGEAGLGTRAPRDTRQDIRPLNPAPVPALPLPGGLGNLNSTKGNIAPLRGSSVAALFCAKSCLAALGREITSGGALFLGRPRVRTELSAFGSQNREVLS